MKKELHFNNRKRISIEMKKLEINKQKFIEGLK